MSTVREVASILRKFTFKELKFLKLLGRLTKSFSIIPYSVLRQRSGLSNGDIEFLVKRLQDYKLIRRSGIGIRLLSAGLDALALHSLRVRGILDALGPPIAVGKESDVFEGISPKGEVYAVKFFRIGRTSFRGIKRARGYVEDRIHEWNVINVKSAKREFEILTELSEKKCPVPVPIAVAYHVLGMKEYLALPLFKIKKLDDPLKVFEKALEAVKKCVFEGGYVHSDLSEFNVLVDSKGDVLIIDWPQAVKLGGVSSKDKLLRDITNLTNYFNRKYRLSLNLDEVLLPFIERF